MKKRTISHKISKVITTTISSTALILIARTSFANDLLAAALEGEVKDSLGSGSMFWKIFILIDIILATALAVKSKNPMVFIGVAAIAFIPALLLKVFVF